MALVLADRVQETSPTSGTGTFTLAGAVSGFKTFSSTIGNTNTTYYVAYDPLTYIWEVGIGTVGAGTLTRDTILSNSSGTTAKISFTGNQLNVWCDYPASRAVYEQDDGSVVLDVASSSAALRITQTGAGNALVVEDSANPDATPFVIDANGRVIVGYTSSQTFGGLSLLSLQINGTSQGTSSIATANWGTTVTPPSHIFSKSRGGAVGTHAVLSNNDNIGSLQFEGSDGTAFISAAAINAYVDGTPGLNDMPARMVFSTTADGASTPTERMRIDSAGQVGIGAASATAVNLYVAKNITGGTTSVGVLSQSTVQSDVTTSAYLFRSRPSTAAAAFTLPTLHHYAALQGTIGAGSSVTNQYGFSADSGLTGATNNYGFYSNIASGTGRWNFYAAGTADNYFAGPVVVSTSSSSDALRITQTGAGNALVVEDSANPDASPFVINTTGQVVIGKTVAPVGQLCVSRISADASSNIIAIAKERNGAIVQSGDNLGQLGFYGYDGASYLSSANITAAVDGTPGTNDMPGRLIFSTTADGASSPTERMRIDNAGRVGIGGTPPVSTSLTVGKNITGGVNSYGVYENGSIQSDVTTGAQIFSTYPSTAASAFTLPNLTHYAANQGTIGAGSTVTTQIGFYAFSGLTGATNNYGFYSNIASGTGRYNFYAAGTAANYFAGVVGIGTTATTGTLEISAGNNSTPLVFGNAGGTQAFLVFRNSSTTANNTRIGAETNDLTLYTSGSERARLDSSGNLLITSTGGLGYGTGSGGAVTQATSRTTGVTLNKTNGAITLVSAAGSATYQTFTVTNSTVAATDVIHVSQKSGTDKYIILVTAVAAGSFAITFATTGGTTTEQPVFNFAVIKAVTA